MRGPTADCMCVHAVWRRLGGCANPWRRSHHTRCCPTPHRWRSYQSRCRPTPSGCVCIMLYTHSTHTLLLSLRQLRGPDGSSLSFPTARSTCSNKRRLGILSHRRYPTPSSWVWEENTDAVRVVSALQLVLRSYRNTKLQQGERAAGPPLPCRAVAQCRLCTVSDPLPRQCPHALVCPLVHAGVI